MPWKLITLVMVTAISVQAKAIDPDKYSCTYIQGPDLKDAKSLNVIDRKNGVSKVCLGEAHCYTSVKDLWPDSYYGWSVCPPDKKTGKCTMTPNECLKDEDLDFIDQKTGDAIMRKQLNIPPPYTQKELNALPSGIQ